MYIPVTVQINIWCCLWVSAKKTVPSPPAELILTSGKEKQVGGLKFLIGWYPFGILIIKWFQRLTKYFKKNKYREQKQKHAVKIKINILRLTFAFFVAQRKKFK